MNAKGEFESKIGRLTKSKTYLNFCEEVYGYRMYLFNMMDREQLDFVFNSIPLASDDMVLDLGCGSGSIINCLVEKYGCQGIGIDLLKTMILLERTISLFAI
jgi:cyclopropane fatty-acyl-phospholipid synthase-like methyltransferase